jgi:hypothetical protein
MRIRTYMTIITISGIIVFPIITVFVLMALVCAIAVSGWK